MCVFVYTVIIRKIFETNNFGKCIRSHFHPPDQLTSVTTIRLFDNGSQVRYPIRHVRYFIHKQFQMPLLFIQKYFVIWPRLACKPVSQLQVEGVSRFIYAEIACSG